MKLPVELNKRNIIIASAALFLLLIVLIIVSPDYSALIHDTSGRYFHAQPILLVGDTLICFSDDQYFLKRKNALKYKPGTMWPSVLSMRNIKFIEIFPDIEETDDDDLPIRHYGKFQINASGHVGYLYLSYKNGRPFGTIRFPNWSRGAYEKLKNVKIKDKYVYFTRSVLTPAEMRRTGSPFYFTQEYEGRYLVGGKMIKGQYRTSKGKFLWEATRIK